MNTAALCTPTEVVHPGAASARRKFSAPPLPAAPVSRDAIRAKLAASPARLVLVRAPAGFGKTTLLAQCRSELHMQGVRTAWVTCDEADNDGAQFLRVLAELLHMPAAPLSLEHAAAAIRTRVEEIGAQGEALALFFDDVELVRSAGALALLRELVAGAPPQIRVFIASRGAPAMSLARMRSKRQLLEILAGELRFSREETQAFFKRSGSTGWRRSDIDQIHARTEGWAAGLWFSALAMAQRTAASAPLEPWTGATALIHDYFAEDVLDRQPPALRRFLLCSSILSDLDAASCDAILASHGGAVALASMVQAEVFLGATAQDGGYRYHGLLAAFLRQRLAHELPAEVPRLHRAASQWREAQHQPAEAISHAVAGGDVARALRLLEVHVDQFLQTGRMRLMARWFAALPEAELWRRPALSMAAIWSTACTQGPQRAQRLLERSGWTLADPIAQPHLLALEALLLGMTDLHEAAAERGQGHLRHMPTGNAFAHGMLITATASAMFMSDRPDEARRLLELTRTVEVGQTPPLHRRWAQTVEAAMDLEEAQLHRAATRLPRVCADPAAQGAALGAVLRAGLAFEAGDTAQAESLLELHLPRACQVGAGDAMILGHVMLARMAFDRRQLDRAWQWLGELEQAGEAHSLARVSASARLERARFLTLQGNGEAAHVELTLASRSEVWARVARLRCPAHDLEDLELGCLRWGLAFGDLPATLHAILQAQEQARRRQKMRRVLKLELLRAMTLHKMGKTSTAQAVFAAVVQRAAGQGFWRLLVDEGPLVASLAAVWLARQAAADAIGRVAERDLVARLLQMDGAPLEEDPAPQTESDKLTRTEVRMLRLVAAGHSNVALASKLFVSDSTVRTHLRNINQKLQAANRTQAVAIARQRGVIV